MEYCYICIQVNVINFLYKEITRHYNLPYKSSKSFLRKQVSEYKQEEEICSQQITHQNLCTNKLEYTGCVMQHVRYQIFAKQISFIKRQFINNCIDIPEVYNKYMALYVNKLREIFCLLYCLYVFTIIISCHFASFPIHLVKYKILPIEKKQLQKSEQLSIAKI